MKRHLKLLSFLAVLAAGIVSAGWFWWSRVPPQQRFHRALRALEKGDFATVRADADHLRGDARYSHHVRLLEAGLSLKSGRYADALAQSSFDSLSGDLRVFGMLISGESLYRLGRLAESEDVMRRLATEQPEHAEAHRLLAAIYYDLGAMDQAIVELKHVIRLAKKDFRPHRLLGLIYRDFEQFQKAAEHYEKALDLQPPATVSREIVRELGATQIRLRKYQAALDALESAGDDARVLAMKSECLWSLGRNSEARRLLDRARRLNPDERSVLLLDARIRLDAGNAKAAIVSLTRALSRDPHDHECRYQLALAYRRLGETSRYEAEIALMKRSQGLYARLSELNTQAIRRPRDAELRDELVDVCRKLGKQDMANMWRKAAEACRAATRSGRVAPSGDAPRPGAARKSLRNAATAR